jgi:hypothetical protein
MPVLFIVSIGYIAARPYPCWEMINEGKCGRVLSNPQKALARQLKASHTRGATEKLYLALALHTALLAVRQVMTAQN